MIGVIGSCCNVGNGEGSGSSDTYTVQRRRQGRVA